MSATRIEIPPRTWPTPAHIDAALEALADGLSAVDSVAEARYGYLVDANADQRRDDGFWLREGVPVPTYHDIGVLAEFIARLEAEADELGRWIADLKADLQLARLNGLADDRAHSVRA